MRSPRIPRAIVPALILLCGIGAGPIGAHAQSTPALGFRAGASSSPDEVYLGLQGEFDGFLAGENFAPSLDLGLDDPRTTVFNADLRWYLLRLPETGLRFYGAAGPALLLDPQTEFGLNLTVGLNVPMHGGRRYNVELRFGFGDVPELKIGGGILFGF